jgi:hypothetical protein
MLEWMGLSPQEWSPVALLSLVVLMILFGWLVPRWALVELRKDRDAWKLQATEQQAINKTLADAAKENAEPAKTFAKVAHAAQDRLGVPDAATE